MTKEQFLTVYNAHKPSKFVEFAYRLVSYKEPSILVLIVFFIPFIVGFVLNLNHFEKMWIVGLAFVPFALLILYRFVATILNGINIYRIRKELGITKQQYIQYVSQFLT